MTTGQRFQAFRKEIGLTQQELADKLGIKRSSVARIENGYGNMTVPVMIKAADIFGCSLDTLTGRRVEK